jgi:hypothetical protein
MRSICRIYSIPLVTLQIFLFVSALGCQSRKYNETTKALEAPTSQQNLWPQNWQNLGWAPLKPLTNCDALSNPPIPPQVWVERESNKKKYMDEIRNSLAIEQKFPLKKGEEMTDPTDKKFGTWNDRISKASWKDYSNWNDSKKLQYFYKGQLAKAPQGGPHDIEMCKRFVQDIESNKGPYEINRAALKMVLDGKNQMPIAGKFPISTSSPKREPAVKKSEPQPAVAAGPGEVCSVGRVMMSTFGKDWVAEWYQVRSKTDSETDLSNARRMAHGQCSADIQRGDTFKIETYCKDYGCE